jgi:hypothetical protein
MPAPLIYKFMECLESLIGIRGCEESSNTLFVNDLPGMSLNVADAGADNETENGIDLIKNRIKFASQYIKNDILNYVNDKFNNLLEQNKVGYFTDEVVLASNRFYGVRIKVKKGRFFELKINRVAIMLDNDATTDLKIFDLRTGIELFTKSVDVEANKQTEIEIDFNYSTKGQEVVLFVCHTADVAGHFKSNLLSGSDIHGCTSCIESGYLSYSRSGYVSYSNSIKDVNFVTGNDTGGLSVDFNMECSIENYVCSIKNQLAWSLLYKTGSMIMQEVINSKQYNTIVVIHREDNEELLSYYEAEYAKAMNQLTAHLRLPNDICFECNPRIRKQIQIP